MIKNYLTVIIRNLWRNKLFTIINVVGLGVGIASLVWGFQDYRYCLSYDDFHNDNKSIFRILTKAEASDNLKGVCPAPLASQVKIDFPEVSETVRWESRSLLVKSTQGDPFETVANFTNQSFFEFFNFPLLKGTVNLNDPTSMVITEQAAKKYFGDTEPIGKTLLMYSDEEFRKPLTITGVLKDPPFNSSLQFEMITSTANLLRYNGSEIKSDDWSWFSDAIFLRLSNPSNAKKLSNDFKKYLPLEQIARHDVKLASFMLQPLSKVADSNMIENNSLLGRPTDAATYAPLLLGILILLSASLNFANTSVAQSNKRLIEMGVRKVLGSSSERIMFQQLLECALIVLLAIGFSILINNYWLPTFNKMFLHVNLSAHYLSDHTLFVFFTLTFVGVSLLAGFYPALYITRFNAANIFRGSVQFGGNNIFSRILLVLQIIISFITVIAGVGFSRNTEFQRTFNYGYDRANIIGMVFPNKASYTAIRDELVKNPNVDGIAGTINNIGFTYRRIAIEAKGEKKESIYIEAGENYVDLMRLKLKTGRLFNSLSKSDNYSVLVNEKLAFQLGWKPEEAIGQRVKMGDSIYYTIVGVLKDFIQNTLVQPIQPVVIGFAPPEKYSQIIIRAKQGNLLGVYNQTKAAWSRIYPMIPFRGYFQDQVSADALGTNESIARIFYWFAIISTVLALTGMFALVSLNILKKMREIAIRKVLGANSINIFQLVMKGYLWIFLLSASVGCIIGYSLTKLLMDLIFQINAGVSPTSLIVSFIGVLLLNALTISSKIWVVLHTKAIDVLKEK